MQQVLFRGVSKVVPFLTALRCLARLVLCVACAALLREEEGVFSFRASEQGLGLCYDISCVTFCFQSLEWIGGSRERHTPNVCYERDTLSPVRSVFDSSMPIDSSAANVPHGGGPPFPHLLYSSPTPPHPTPSTPRLGHTLRYAKTHPVTVIFF